MGSDCSFFKLDYSPHWKDCVKPKVTHRANGFQRLEEGHEREREDILAAVTP